MNMRRSVTHIADQAVVVLSRIYLTLLLCLVFWAVVPTILGWHVTVVSSGSMEPLIHVGDVLAAQPVTPEQINDGAIGPGQVLLAQNPASPDRLYTHRVESVNADGDFITKGDANSSADSTPLDPSLVIGLERLRVPLIGLPVQAARQGDLLPAAILIVTMVLAQLAVRRERKSSETPRSSDLRPRSLKRRARRAVLSFARQCRGRVPPVKTYATGIVIALTTIALIAPEASAAFSAKKASPGNTHSAAAFFPVPDMSAKPLRFGVSEPGNSIAEVDVVAREVNEYPTYMQTFRDFTTPFDMTLIASTIAKGMTPVITWEPWSAAVGGTTQPAYKLSTITGGAHDAYLTSVANQLKAAGNPRIGIRFAHEMNGNWYPWAETVNGNQPGDYVQAWRHVVDLFTAEGVTNVDWIWAPNIPCCGTDIATLYPGTTYVTVVGLDGYNFGAMYGNWVRPWDVLGSGLGQLATVAPDKNIIISETGTTETEGADTKATWILDFVYYINHWGDGKPQKIVAFIWFNHNKERPWRIDSSEASRLAMKKALSDR